MKLLNIILILLFIVSCNSTTTEPIDEQNKMLHADDSQISDSLINVYRDDAFRLAINYYVKIDSSNIDSINVPEKYISDFYNGLIHIHNSKELSQRDSVVELYHIHTWVSPELRTFYLYVDSSATWIHNWQGALNYFTGYKELDSLMVKYNISILEARYYSNDPKAFYQITLFTKDRMNIAALMNYFKALNGINYAYPRRYTGYGNDILVEYDGDKLIYKYHLGWSRCYSGDCNKHHYWFFEVDFNGNVKFIKSYGSSLDDYRHS